MSTTMTTTPALADRIPSVGPMMRGPIWAGLLIVLLFFGGFGSWAAMAPLSSGALASGIVSPDSSRKTIQHFEGGIIQAIHVREGDRVTAGQPLVTLQSTLASTSYESTLDQLLRLRVMRARLMALALGAEELELDEETASTTDPDLLAFIESQKSLFSTQRGTQEAETQIVERQVTRLQSQIGGLETAIRGQETEKGLIESDLANLEKLLANNLVTQREYNQLQRARAQLESAIAQNRASIASAGQSMEQARIELLRSQEDTRSQNEREASEVNNQIAVLEQDLASRRDVLDRTQIVSPVDGIVLNLRSHTQGGVVAAGEPIMDVVPADDDLIVVARLQPRDIDLVTVGLNAHVVLQPFASRNALPLNGEVIQVAADSTFDEMTGHSYYALRVRVPAEELAKHQGMYMSPGMPADVTVVTGARTMLQYLAEPLIRSIRNAFVYD